MHGKLSKEINQEVASAQRHHFVFMGKK